MKRSPERDAAIAAGESFYTTGKPCSRGHMSKRYVVGNRCATCQSEATMRCQAKQPEHPARIAARTAGQRHFAKEKPCKNGHENKFFVASGQCVQCSMGGAKRWRKKNPGSEAAGARRRRAKDPTGHRAEAKRWYENNREKAREIADRWKAANPERRKELGRAGTATRRAKAAGNGGSFTADDIFLLFGCQNGRCAICPSTENLEIDHILPVILGGSSDPSNLQLLCRPCNRSKGGKHPDIWRKSLVS